MPNFTKEESINRIAYYIRSNVGSQDWNDHIDNISGYMAAGLAISEAEFKKRVKARLKYLKEARK